MSHSSFSLQVGAFFTNYYEQLQQSAANQRNNKEGFGVAPSLWPRSPSNKKQLQATTRQPVAECTDYS